MLIIRDNQMRVLHKAMREHYVQQIKHHVKEEFPDVYEDAGEEQVEKNINLGIDKSGRYGITQGKYVAMFVYLMLLFGSNFDDEAVCSETASLLNNSDLAANEKLSKVLTYKTEQMK